MKQPQLIERSGVCSMIGEAIRNNQRIHTLFGKRLNGWRFNLFVKQCAKYLRRKNGVLISEEGHGLAVIVPISTESDQRRRTDWWPSLFVFSLKRIGAMRRFRNKTQQLLPTEPHLFFMLLLTDEQRNGQSQVIQLRDELFKMSEIMQLPVYAQTSSKQTQVMFERFGFETYGKIAIPNKDEFMYFMVRKIVQ